MVDQKSENFRTLAGNHGGLRRGTAAAALGAVLVLSAGVPASNAAAPALLTDAGESIQSSPDADAVPGTALEADPTVSHVKTTADGTLGLEAWAGAILDDDEDDDESSASPAPTASPTRPSFSPSSTPMPTVPVPTLPATPLPTASPAPSPSGTAASGSSPTSQSQTSPSQTSVPAPATARPGYSPAAGVPAPATTQPAQHGAARSGASQHALAAPQAPAAQPGLAPRGALAPATGAAAEAPGRSAKGKPDTATSRQGVGITSGVWGSGRLSSPMNMGTVDSRYSVSRPSSAVLGSSQSGPVSPLVWAGAGLVLLAGAAGLVAYKLRRAL